MQGGDSKMSGERGSCEEGVRESRVKLGPKEIEGMTYNNFEKIYTETGRGRLLADDCFKGKAS